MVRHLFWKVYLTTISEISVARRGEKVVQLQCGKKCSSYSTISVQNGQIRFINSQVPSLFYLQKDVNFLKGDILHKNDTIKYLLAEVSGENNNSLNSTVNSGSSSGSTNSITTDNIHLLSTQSFDTVNNCKQWQ